jgi:glycerate 2-kinase
MSKRHALQIFKAALQAADPEQAVLRHLRLDGKTLVAGRRRYRLSQFDRIQVIGAGKASAAMARAVERVLGRQVAGGLINVPDGVQGARPHRIEIHESSHPVPDERGVDGAQRILQIAREAGPRDLVLCLISGGASALMPAPAPPLTLAAKQAVTRQLLACGATVHEINTVRKHISQIKGGQLAKIAWPATMIALILSDVIGDDLDVIGSGPTVPDCSTVADAARILEKYSIHPLPLHETPKHGDPHLARVQNLIVGSNRLAIAAAAGKARALGYRTLMLSTFIEGETREIASMHSAIVKEVQATGRPVKPPACILSGGETTVTLRGKGMGGRNQEFVLAAAIALNGFGPVTIFSAGTDGMDGPTDAAGAFADQTTVDGARAVGMDAAGSLANNDSYRFFHKVGGLVQTGPTGTNVMDIRIFLVP